MTEKFTEDIGQAMQTNEVILSDAACIGIIVRERLLDRRKNENSEFI